MDECENHLACPGQECVNSPGSFQCRPCRDGHRLRNGRCAGTAPPVPDPPPLTPPPRAPPLPAGAAQVPPPPLTPRGPLPFPRALRRYRPPR
ncbi:hypothetical protein KIL84_001569 [Mauremys mutica]|uniref:EGF-like calcium-binding domain-containing protein n=1 Tax=Mauremys mutica TaxID=74926 RepID=A0A9D3XKC6_9SAUR|nr:hypothetical protein KIL84_001569 [Mauremys mutica]